MNKKIYTAPQVEVLKVETYDAIAASFPGPGYGDYEDSSQEKPDVDDAGNIYGD